jgi:hypothetical protein
MVTGNDEETTMIKSVKAMAVAMAMVGGPTGAALANDGGERVEAEQVVVTSQLGGDSDSISSSTQAYCYWETYCDVYGYCWTAWVCF